MSTNDPVTIHVVGHSPGPSPLRVAGWLLVIAALVVLLIGGWVGWRWLDANVFNLGVEDAGQVTVDRAQPLSSVRAFELVTVKNSYDRKMISTGGLGAADANRTTPGMPTQTSNASVMVPQKVADAPGYGGALPKPDLTTVGATTVAEPLHNPIPPEMPAPIQPIVAAGTPPAPFPPPAPSGLPIAPVDSGYQPVPSVTEKPIELPIAPLMIK